MGQSANQRTSHNFRHTYYLFLFLYPAHKYLIDIPSVNRTDRHFVTFGSHIPNKLSFFLHRGVLISTFAFLQRLACGPLSDFCLLWCFLPFIFRHVLAPSRVPWRAVAFWTPNSWQRSSFPSPSPFPWPSGPPPSCAARKLHPAPP